MKSHIATPFLLALLWLAALSAATAQNLPSSMAYSVSAIDHAPTDDTQKLLVAGNSLITENSHGLDLSRIPAAPESVVRRIGDPGKSESLQSAFAGAEATLNNAKFWRCLALLGVLPIAYLATRNRPDQRIHGDISELRSFPKKRLAHLKAHA